eukprot:scaffold50270_cov24-Tisochrysis_lutea.AAC.1
MALSREWSGGCTGALLVASGKGQGCFLLHRRRRLWGRWVRCDNGAEAGVAVTCRIRTGAREESRGRCSGEVPHSELEDGIEASCPGLMYQVTVEHDFGAEAGVAVDFMPCRPPGGGNQQVWKVV